MRPAPYLQDTLLRSLLENELERFEQTLATENPGLSSSEIDRYMRAARLFANQLTGGRPRTHGRKAKDS